MNRKQQKQHEDIVKCRRLLQLSHEEWVNGERKRLTPMWVKVDEGKEQLCELGMGVGQTPTITVDSLDFTTRRVSGDGGLQEVDTNTDDLDQLLQEFSNEDEFQLDRLLQE